MESLDVDDLMPYMPLSVREEYVAAERSRPASCFGFTPGVKKWLETCSLPRIERWRDDLRRVHGQAQKRAIKEQLRMIEISEQLPQPYNPRLRPLVHPIHPVIVADLHRQDRHAFHDPDSIEDTRKNNPKLFIKRYK